MEAHWLIPDVCKCGAVMGIDENEYAIESALNKLKNKGGMDMIHVSTNCKECTHYKVCAYKDNPTKVTDRLKETIYRSDTNTAYWELTMKDMNVCIEIYCPDFQKKAPEIAERIMGGLR